MKVDPITLKYLLESMSEGVREMFQVLSSSPTPQSLQVLARIAHKLKGEATVVGFAKLSFHICRLEDAIQANQRLQALKKSHFQALALLLKSVVCECEAIRKNAISAAGKQRATAVNPARGIAVALQVLAEKVGKSTGKQVRLNLTDFQLEEIPLALQKKVRDIAVQLVRNAVVHGIEAPLQRQQAGKSAVGTVSLTLRKSGSLLILTARDNGQGIDLEKIRRRLIIDYNRPVQQIARLTNTELLASLFQPGFTTLNTQQSHAGRGVGLDLVRDAAESLGGKVEVHFKRLEFSQFVVQIPLRASSAKADRIPLLVNAVAAKAPQKRRLNA